MQREFTIRTVELDDRCYEVRLYRRKKTVRVVGYVRLVLHPFEYRQYVTHSSLQKGLWNRGFGVRMYAHAIRFCLRRGYKVRSSTEPSWLAKRVWNSKRLNSKFSIRYRDNQYLVISKK